MSATAVDAQTRWEITDAYNAYAEGIDSKNWSLVRDCFADEVCIDYGAMSAAGGSPDEPRRADDWMLYLKSVINGFDITRHTLTNHRFGRSGEDVVCRAYLVADHVIFAQAELPIATADDVVTVVGEYTNTYTPTTAGWKISASRLEVHWSSGNLELFPRAMQRAAEAAAS